MHVTLTQGQREAAMRTVFVLAMAFTSYGIYSIFLDGIAGLFSGRGDCQDGGTFAAITGLAIPLCLILCVALQFWGLLRPTPSKFAASIILPSLIWLGHLAVNSRDAELQRQCVARTLPEAMQACAANPAEYRRTDRGGGNIQLTLIAPGASERSWSCLYQWVLWHPHYALDVDKSVYAAYRQRHARPPGR